LPFCRLPRRQTAAAAASAAPVTAASTAAPAAAAAAAAAADVAATSAATTAAAAAAAVALTAALAAYNLSAFPDVTVSHGEANETDLAGVDGVFLDPARRTAGHNNTKRQMNADDWSPSLTFALDAARSVGAGGIKLGPGTDRELIPNDAEAQWVAVGDDVVEMGLWFGRARRDDIARSALILTSTGHHELVAPADAPNAPVGELARFVYEPNGAVIRAHLIGDVARSLGGHMIDESIAYITTATASPTPFARGYEVLETTTVDAKAISRALATHDMGRVEIKKRGIDIDPAEFRKKLTLTGSDDGVVILTRAGTRRVALIARRIDEQS
jgi:hypothetical protein